MAIEHLVVLMLENRSFDHMLGALGTNGVNGLTGRESNPTLDGRTVMVSFDARPVGDLKDPGHEFEDVRQQLFDGGDERQPPTMTGFVKSFARYSKNPERIMKCFSPQGVPVLSTLATSYVLCDAWFSSIPGPTSPNRMFAHGATSLGSVLSDPAKWIHLKTIYEQLDQAGVSYKIYNHKGGSLLFSVDYLVHHQHGFAEYNTFVDDCRHGRLPAYSFIEPRYTWDGMYPPTDMHPDADVRDGEALVKEIYQALRSNDALWQKTLFLIVFDEHGGIYDHVVPPSCTPTAETSAHPAFDFGRLGLRVPAIIVSPYAAARVSHRQYEHASIVATVRRLFLHDPALPRLGREASAATFDEELDFTIAAREDLPDFGAGPHVTAAARAVAGPPTELAKEMIRHATSALQRHFPDRLLPTDPTDIRTSQHATEFLAQAREILAEASR